MERLRNTERESKILFRKPGCKQYEYSRGDGKHGAGSDYAPAPMPSKPGNARAQREKGEQEEEY